jgi:hypothetical protein
MRDNLLSQSPASGAVDAFTGQKQLACHSWPLHLDQGAHHCCFWVPFWRSAPLRNRSHQAALASLDLDKVSLVMLSEELEFEKASDWTFYSVIVKLRNICMTMLIVVF